ncbi:signal peptidase II [[Limnothrix rosea] IAM M-220]|uniref:signal peptidase II n=1 Tax=[Limnothrix rosea] IAM M-220 TaxID=454133 RepID=UPI00095CFD2B|nr:signal peptidase II [[Limnothrix rosea] IAM M-220]OKH16877.1 signal peptidase II [[Limnothrix rosea] IAM M-220]
MALRKDLLKNRWFWIIALIGLILDQLTKTIVLQTFPEVGDTIPLWNSVFHFTYVQNTGAAFSIFTDGVHWLRWLSLFVSLGLMALAWFGDRLNMWEQLGYGFILSGAMGNGVDRFLFGYVVDFLDFRLINFPVFNIADVCINIGIACLLLNIVFYERLSGKNSD